LHFKKMILLELRWARLLLVLSGAAALGWQFIWTTQWTLLLGHEIYAVLAVAAAFLGGLCLGTWLIALPKMQSLGMLRVYVFAELLIAAWGVLLTLGLPQMGPFFAAGLGETPSAFTQAMFAFLFPFVVLLPSTFAMGVTLPAMMGLLRSRSKDMADLYAANTLGACIGVALIVFYALPEWGISQSAWGLCAVNVCCALLAWVMWRNQEPVQKPAGKDVKFDGGLTLFLLGFWGMAYQVLAIRVLSLVTENTVYSYALLLMVYLAFHAMGAALYKLIAKENTIASVESVAIPLLIVSVVMGAWGLSMADSLFAWPSMVWGTSMWSALAGEGFAALIGLAIPSAAMGFVFAQQTIRQDGSQGWVAKSLFFNILGASLAPLVVGLLVFPAWGAAGVICLVLLGYTALQSFKTVKDTLKLWPLGLTYVVLGGFFSWNFLNIPPGGKALFFRDGEMAAVSVVQDLNNVARLQINNRAQEGSSASSWVERRLAVLPLMFHEHPQKVLLLGLGTGFTANAAAEFGDVKVQAVELLAEVVQASEIFKRYPHMPKPTHPVQTITADARRFVNASTQSFDVIVADVYHPARSGAATLYTVEHFQKIKDTLNDGGVFCQWLALFQMDTQTLRTIVAAYQEVYPEAKAVLVSNSLDSPAIGLMARKNAAWPLVSDIQKKWLDPQIAFSAKQARLDDPYAVWGTVMADGDSLRAFTSGVKPNTDDHLLVSFKAPWVTYAPQETPRARLQEILGLWTTKPELAEPAGTQKRLSAYSQAHKQYLELGMNIRANEDPFTLLNAVQENLFTMIQLSPDFLPAQETLGSLADAVSAQHPNLAREVETKLKQLNLTLKEQ
jgi:spermidine synthase